KTDVLPKCLEPREPLALAIGDLCLLYAAEPYQRIAASLFRCHSRAQIVLDMHCEVTIELGCELFVTSSTAEDADQAHPQPSETPYYDSSAGARNRARMAVACSQSRVSRSSCFRPARVSL